MASSAETRRRRKEAGLCTECGKPAREGKTTCAECAAKRSVVDRRRLEERRGGPPGKRGARQKWEYIAWDGPRIVKRGSYKELAEFFGMTPRMVGDYARLGFRRRKSRVFIERKPARNPPSLDMGSRAAPEITDSQNSSKES